MQAPQIKKAGRCPLRFQKKCSPACQESFFEESLVEDVLSVFFSLVSVLLSDVLHSAGLAVLWFLPA
jgi:hypothetical protein